MILVYQVILVNLAIRVIWAIFVILVMSINLVILVIFRNLLILLNLVNLVNLLILKKSGNSCEYNDFLESSDSGESAVLVNLVFLQIPVILVI